MSELGTGIDKVEIQVPTSRAEMRQITITAPVWECERCKGQNLLMDRNIVAALNRQGSIQAACPRCEKTHRIVKGVIIGASRQAATGYRGTSGGRIMRADRPALRKARN